jgi:beta-glucosidase
MKHNFFLTIIFAALSTLAYGQQYPFQNSKLSDAARAKDLCSRLTLEEKASLMMNNSAAVKRLGIPAFQWWNEALHGVARAGKATVFPQTIGMAASFDDALLRKVFDAVSDEARAKYNVEHAKKSGQMYEGVSFWTPNINIFRDPRWGRGQETYGEDPYLTSRMGLQVVNGLQGGAGKHRYYKAFACAKHFAVHSGPEWNRHRFNVEDLSPRDLFETYLPAFKTLVTKGNVREVMCAYQRLEGEPCCGNNRLLYQILRSDWGYDGIVVSDCGAIDDFWVKGRHEVEPDASHASARGVSTGTDLNCGSAYGSLPDAVKNGLVSEAKVDSSLTRLIIGRIRLGEFDPDSVAKWNKIPYSVVESPAHQQLALRMALESMVLLHNPKNALPLNKTVGVVAVMGPNANDTTMMWGNYNGTPSQSVTILKGIQNEIGEKNVKFIDGCGYVIDNLPTKNSNLLLTDDELLAQVGDVKTVIFCGGISPRLEGEEMPGVKLPGFKGGDRVSIQLPEKQRNMLRRLHDAGKRVIFVNCSGSAIGLQPELSTTDAILQAWYPGEQGGTAVAKTLFGDYNPSGKLPVTFYKDTTQLPDYENYSMANRTYRYFKGIPVFPFGYGLSYTNFQFGKAKYLNHNLIVPVTNIGKREGDEVVQLYVRALDDINGPIKSLRGFKRVNILPGKTVNVIIETPSETFERFDEKTNTVHFVPGVYRLFYGNSSADTDLKYLDVKIK